MDTECGGPLSDRNCRACGEARLVRFLELGPQPLGTANLATIDEAADELRRPLSVCFCEACALVQIADALHLGLFDESLHVDIRKRAKRAVKMLDESAAPPAAAPAAPAAPAPAT